MQQKSRLPSAVKDFDFGLKKINRYGIVPHLVIKKNPF